MSGIFERYLEIQEEVRALGGERVRLMAVSKTHPWESIKELADKGPRLFGESRAQEAESKFTGKDISGFELHFIGQLQRNKAKIVLEYFDWLESVDSPRLVRTLQEQAARRGKTLNVLIEMNTSGEEQKAGVRNNDELEAILEVLEDCPNLRPRGLMTIAPWTGERDLIRSSFRSLRIKFEELERAGLSPEWDTLSMGMSGDYREAIEEGSNLVRVGTAIFGRRE